MVCYAQLRDCSGVTKQVALSQSPSWETALRQKPLVLSQTCGSCGH